jgi:DNA modification methylase
MYWLLSSILQKEIRDKITKLTVSLSAITGNPQDDQIFPYVGRKDRRKAIKVVEFLSPTTGLVIEPFAGSGSLVYAISEAHRAFFANEWEPYAWRMSNSPWRLPNITELDETIAILKNTLDLVSHTLYKTICTCGHEHTLDSLFFDRVPLRYTGISHHERLGQNGENITYRGKYSCPICHRTEKYFDNTDLEHLQLLSAMPVDPLFDTTLIENSRINLTGPFTTYGNLFPHRSKLALIRIWQTIEAIACSPEIKYFLQDAFLSILPQAKFKDYRSKSQDLHCPDIQLREVNIIYRLYEQIDRRKERLTEYSFHQEPSPQTPPPISCHDFRDFMASVSNESSDLVFTDPPWLDGNAYFEKAQLYHPWLGYQLTNDHDRLEKEFVITDAPSRPEHNTNRWWQDMARFFLESRRILKINSYVALFFRPIPAKYWLTNLNKIKLTARQNGFEPLLSIDVGSSDPSMRVQQSASYVFSRDIIFVFLKLDSSITRTYSGNNDIDQITFEIAEGLQETLFGPFTYQQWRHKIADRFNELGLVDFNLPDKENVLLSLFTRYCDQVSPGQFLPKLNTPFSGQLFDIPAIERLFTYVPHVINTLTSTNDLFAYDQFLLSLSTFVENGTRSLISQIEELDIKTIISPYAEPIEGGRFFRKRSIPQISVPIQQIMELDPYRFEEFIGQLLKALGFTNVAIIGRAGDRGVDLVADDQNQRKTVVQCKRFIGHNVSATPIQRLHSFAITRNATRKILVTTSDFTPQAIQEAHLTQTETINGQQLEELVAQHMNTQI